MQDYFDPQTGEIIGGDVGGDAGGMGSVNNSANAANTTNTTNTTSAVNTDNPNNAAYMSSPMPNMNMAMKPPKKKGIGLWIGIGCGIVAVIAIAVVLVVKLFSGSAAKIGTAMANTFKETSQIQKDLNIIDMLIDGNASVQLDMEYARQTIGMSGTYDFSDKHKAVSMNVNGDLDGIGDFSVDLAVELDKNKLAISLQPAVDEILTYYYTKDNKGDLMDILEDEDIDIDEMNASLKKFYELDLGSAATYKDMWSTIAEAVLKEAKNIKIEKIDKKEEFEVNDKKRNCGGYQMEITEDDMEVMIDAARDAVKKELEDISAEGDMRDAIEDMYDDLFDELEDEISDMKDIDLSFYIYDKQIACIRIEESRDRLDIIFHGGDYPTQNIEMVLDGSGYDDETVFELTGETKDKVEEMELVIEGESLFALEYDTKSGDLSVESESEDLEFEAVVKRTKSGLTVEIDDIEDISLALTITDDGTIKPLKGDEIDLGEVDEDDIYDFVEDLYDEYSDLLYGLYW